MTPVNDTQLIRTLQKWTYRRAQKSWAKKRRKAIEMESYEALEHYVDLIRRMENSSEYQGSILAREAQEISAELVNRYYWRENPDAAFFELREVPEGWPTGWPRLTRITLQALGSDALLALRDDEDRVRDRWVSRAAEVLKEIEKRGVGLDQITDGEAGAWWVDEHCMRDPELAADALLLVHPNVDLIGRSYNGEFYTNLIWKPPAPKTTLRPV
jgi:hypothetical protein